MKHSEAIKLLLVEDNPDDLALMLRALDKAELSSLVHVARDGLEAVEFLFGEGAHSGRNSAEEPKVILLDLKLPKLDGLEVLRRIKGDPRTKLIPVVVLTSSKEQRDIVESYRLGVNSCIVKPVNYERFTETVRHLGCYWLLLNQPPKISE